MRKYLISLFLLGLTTAGWSNVPYSQTTYNTAKGTATTVLAGDLLIYQSTTASPGSPVAQLLGTGKGVLALGGATITSGTLLVRSTSSSSNFDLVAVFETPNGDVTNSINGVGSMLIGAAANSLYSNSGENLVIADNSDGIIRLNRANTSRTARIAFWTSTTENWRMGETTGGNSDWELQNQGSSPAAAIHVALSSSFVGMGTSTPQAALQLSRNGPGTVLGQVSHSLLALTDTQGLVGNLTQIDFGYGGALTYAPAAIAGLVNSQSANTSSHLVFATRLLTTDSPPLERMRITDSGLVGVGTTTPTYMLDVAGANGAVKVARFQSAANSGYTQVLIQTPSGAATTDAELLFMSPDGTAVGDIFNFGGDMYIDGTSIHLRGGSGATSVDAFASTFTVKSSGSVGIGTASPGSLLDVNGAATIRGQETVTGSSVTIAPATGVATLSVKSADNSAIVQTDGGSAGDASEYLIKSAGTGRFYVGANVNSNRGGTLLEIGAFGQNPSITAQNGGIIGVGINIPASRNPQANLDVEGNAQFGTGATKSTFTTVGSLNLALSARETITSSGYTTLGKISESHLVLGDVSGIIGYTTQIGLGYYVPSNTYVPASIAAITHSQSAQTTQDLVFATRILTTDSAPLERMRIMDSGSVGIGTSSPMTLLDVNGSAQFGSNAAKSTFTATGNLLVPGQITAGSGIQGSSGTFSGQVQASSFNIVGTAYLVNGVTVIDGSRNVISGSSITTSGGFFGNGSGITGVTAGSVSAANVSAGTFATGVLLPAGSLTNGPVASSILPSTVAYTSVSNTFSAAAGNSFTYGVSAGSESVSNTVFIGGPSNPSGTLVVRSTASTNTDKVLVVQAPGGAPTFAVTGIGNTLIGEDAIGLYGSNGEGIVLSVNTDAILRMNRKTVNRNGSVDFYTGNSFDWRFGNTSVDSEMLLVNEFTGTNILKFGHTVDTVTIAGSVTIAPATGIATLTVKSADNSAIFQTDGGTSGDTSEVITKSAGTARFYSGINVNSNTAGARYVIGRSAVDPSIVLDASRNVGISMDESKTPQASLDVNGNAQFGTGATKSTFTATGNLLVPGSVGIGTSSPAQKLHVAGGNVGLYLENTNGQSGFTQLFLADVNGSNNGAEIYYQGSGQGLNGNANSLVLETFTSTGSVAIRTNSADRIVVNGTGQVLIDTNSIHSSINNFSGNPYVFLDQNGDSNSGLVLSEYSADANGAEVDIYKTRGAASTPNVSLINGDTVGLTAWLGSNGSAYKNGARLTVSVEGNPTASAVPMKFTFRTVDNGGASHDSIITSSGDFIAARNLQVVGPSLTVGVSSFVVVGGQSVSMVGQLIVKSSSTAERDGDILQQWQDDGGNTFGWLNRAGGRGTGFVSNQTYAPLSGDITGSALGWPQFFPIGSASINTHFLAGQTGNVSNGGRFACAKNRAALGGGMSAATSINTGDTICDFEGWPADGAQYDRTTRMRFSNEVGTTLGGGGVVSFWTAANGDGNVTERMRVNSTGLVGINTTAPDSQLHVVGPSSLTVPGERITSSNNTLSVTHANTNYRSALGFHGGTGVPFLALHAEHSQVSANTFANDGTASFGFAMYHDQGGGAPCIVHAWNGTSTASADFSGTVNTLKVCQDGGLKVNGSTLTVTSGGIVSAPSQPGITLYFSGAATQNLKTASTTPVYWGTADAQQNIKWSVTADSSTVTIPTGAGGVYHISASFRFPASTATFDFLRISVNGTVQLNCLGSGSATLETDISCANRRITLAAGDTIQANMFQNSGVDMSVCAQQGTCYMSIQKGL